MTRSRDAYATEPPRAPEPGAPAGGTDVAERSDEEPAGEAATPVIVAVGASAGGLQAFERFLASIPPDPAIALIYIQHLEPTHKSHIVDLVAPYTDLRVQQAEDGQRVEEGVVYIGPPGRYVTVKDGTLRLQEMGERRGVRYPVDTLFHSLAEDQGDRAIAVVLTGTGSDGTAGVKAIKAAGGTVYVQDPATAEQRSMPASAIGTDLVDEILPIDEIPKRIAAYVAHPFIREPQTSRDGDHDAILPILTLLFQKGQVDFRKYKTMTLKRRIERRMGLNHIRDFGAYHEFLQQHTEEMGRLQKDLLISVTEFFRDAEAWQVLADKALPPLLEATGPDRPLRAWTAGCATGEEAYSLMMLLLDQMDEPPERSIQYFATDINADSLAIARNGRYPAGALEQVPAGYAQRFFREMDDADQYRVIQPLREPVTFAVHDLLKDPPFSKLDIITCRNLLIYLTPEAQEHVLNLFHFALRPGGILFLGTAEGRGQAAAGFEVISKKWCIYRRGEGPARLHHEQQTVAPDPRRADRTPPPVAVEKPLPHPRRKASVAERADAWLLATYAPAAVVINDRHEILHLHGPLGRYLELPHGEPILDLNRMPREGLRPHLRAAVREAIKTGERVDLQHIPVGKRDSAHWVDVRIEPLGPTDATDRRFIVALKASPAPPSATGPGDDATKTEAAKQDEWVQRLEDELHIAQEDLRNTIEELESSNERLRASNEEILSMNEEFRSTNEELETSKEELQSLNEELTALNHQLRDKVEILEATTNDLENLLRATDVPTVFLDTEGRIRRYTPSITRLMSLIPSDVGRPLGDITRKFDDDDLLRDIDQVLDSLIPQEKEITSSGGQRYLRRIQPYRTTDNRITGTVLIFMDVEGLKQAADAVDVARRYAEGIVETLHEPILVLDDRHRVLSANRAFHERFGYEPTQTQDRPLRELGGGEWDIPALRRLLDEDLPVEPRRNDYEIEHDFANLGHRTMVINAQRILRPGRPGEAQAEHGILLVFEDITEQKATQQADAAFKEELDRRVRERTAQLERTNRILREANEALDAFSYVVGHDLKEPTRAIESILSIIEEDHAAGLPDDVLGLFRKARAANRRLSTLVVGLLTFSRAAAPNPVELAPVNIAKVVEDANHATRFEALLQERNAHLEITDRDTEVLAEPDVLAQVLANLILNAIKHNPGERPLIRIRATEDHESNEVHLVVEDDGPGFSSAVMASFPTGVTSTREGGFGLLIARRGVARMQGRIWLDKSELGGAAVHITLPGVQRKDADEGQGDR